MKTSRGTGIGVRLLVTAALLLPGAVPAALAHHVLGLPHYKYSAEYPQVPYLEVIAQVGPHDLDFTYFPGTPRPGETVRFKLYIQRRETGEVFREPLTVQTYQKKLFGRAVPVGEPFTIRPGSGPEANDYKFHLAFDDPEAYEVRVSFPGPDGMEIIPFGVSIGETDNRPLIIGAGVVLGGAVLIVGVLKRRREARARASEEA